MDVDVMLSKPLNDIEVPFGFKIYYGNKAIASNAILAASPKENLVADLIKTLKANYENLSLEAAQEKRTLAGTNQNHGSFSTLMISGPGLIHYFLKAIFGSDMYHFLSILDCETFGSFIEPNINKLIFEKTDVISNEDKKIINLLYFEGFKKKLDAQGKWIEQYEADVKKMKSSNHFLEI